MKRRLFSFHLPEVVRTDRTYTAPTAQDRAPEPQSQAILNETFLGNVDVRAPDLVVVTADHADPRVNSSVQEVLRLMRDHKGVDVVFVADLNECGRHTLHGDAEEDALEHVSAPTDSLEALWGERVVADRQQQDCPPPCHPAPGRHIHSRIVSEDGTVYGTLCCICADAGGAAPRVDQKMLRHTAALTALKIEQSLRDELAVELETS